MKYCNACHAQLPDEQRRCLHCGGRLEPLTASTLSSRDLAAAGDFVLLARREPADAAPSLEQLSAAAIPLRVVGEGGTKRVDSQYGSFGAYAAIEIHVSPADLERAQVIVRAELEPLAHGLDVRAPEPGACPACHGRLPETAASCPECGLCFPG